MTTLVEPAYRPGAHARANPDKPAIIVTRGSGASPEETITYAERADSARLARAWRAAGLRPGDGVALLVENHPRFLVVAWAAQRCGLYFTPISTQLTPPEVRYILSDSGASVLVASARTVAVATEAAAGLEDQLRLRFLVDPAPEAPAGGFAGWDDPSVPMRPSRSPTDRGGSTWSTRRGRPAVPRGSSRRSRGRRSGRHRGAWRSWPTATGSAPGRCTCPPRPSTTPAPCASP